MRCWSVEYWSVGLLPSHHSLLHHSNVFAPMSLEATNLDLRGLKPDEQVDRLSSLYDPLF